MMLIDDVHAYVYAIEWMVKLHEHVRGDSTRLIARIACRNVEMSRREASLQCACGHVAPCARGGKRILGSIRIDGGVDKLLGQMGLWKKNYPKGEPCYKRDGNQKKEKNR